MTAYAIPDRTEKGLKYVGWSIALYVGGLVLFLVGGVILTAAMGSYEFNPQDPLGGFFGVLIGTLAFVCGGAVILLVAVVFFFIGFYHLHSGRDEYGPAHRDGMGRSLTLLIASFILIFVSFVVSMAATPMMEPVGTLDFEALSASLRLAAAIQLPFGIVQTLLVGLMFLYMIRALASPFVIRVVWAAISVGLMVAFVTFYISAFIVPAFVQQLAATQDPSAMFGAFSGLLGPGLLASGVQILAGLLFFIAVRETARRVRDGEVPRAPIAPEALAGPPYAIAAQPIPPVFGPSPPSQAAEAGAEFCPRCGRRVEGFRFCPSCGSAVAGTGGHAGAGPPAVSSAEEE